MTTLKVLLTFQRPWREIPELAALCRQGVDFVQIPLTSTQSVECPGLWQAVTPICEGWLAVLSQAGAKGLHSALRGLGTERRPPVACVGQVTADAMRVLGWQPEVTGHDGALALFHELRERGVRRVVLAKGDKPSAGVHEARQAGMAVEEFQVYRNVLPEGALEQVQAGMPSFGAVCLASPSAVERLSRVWKGGDRPLLLTLGGTTSASVKKRGWPLFHECDTRQISGFAEGLSRIMSGT
ncbi:MAG: uroporphyrinogen-III synthase [Planctomycetota bacterium]